MTYDKILKLTGAFLSGDTYLPEDDDTRIVLLEYALEMVALTAASQKLKVVVTDLSEVDFETVKIVSITEVTRRPKLPVSKDDEIDIDQGLTYAVARIMASSISHEKFAHHYQVASSIIKSYNETISALYGETI